jgi:DNA mismatch repair protein MutS2
MRDVFDGIHAKAVFAITIQGVIPQLVNEPVIRLKRAVHPLLWLRQQEQQEQTIPLDIELDQEKRIMVISGPNAGGKTVAMKTVGLLQLMMQSGLLVPVLPDSVMGIFTSLFILIGDRQSIENDLSTYSSHLTHLRYFTAHAHAKTLFFIDELGGGTDPQLGGAMAEAILEELALKQSLGIVTTHYLNLKIMADRVAGLQNASMQFDEQNLKPLFTLKPGIPGSSYTFSMAARVGMAEHIIQRARQLSEKQQIRLESLLRKTEQQSRKLTEERQQLQTLISENKKKESRLVNELNREKHRQEMERLKLQNVESARKRTALRELESTARKLIQAWRKGKDRASIMDELNRILRMAEKTTHAAPVSVSIPADYKRIDDPVVVGSMVFMLKSRKIGIVREIRAKKAVVQLGNVPMQLALDDLVPVVRQENE